MQGQAQMQQRVVMVRLFLTFMGGALVINAFILKLLWADALDISHISALLGSLFLGVPIIVQAVGGIVTGELRMTELVALAVLASFALGEYETAGLVAFFMLLAELLLSRTALGARASIEALIRLTPNTACRITPDGREEEVAVKDLKAGDRVRVRPGENIPADGEVLSGQSTVSQAEVTGESLPIEKGPQDEVFAGTTNLTGLLDIKVTRAGDDTTLGKVKELILRAETTRSPLMRIIDKHVRWYTPTILMLAAMILFFTKDFNRAITALVVTCPTALVLATPTAMVAALSSAARLGILIKNVIHLEKAADLNAVVFDKTGTLTTGHLSVTRLAPAENVDGAELLKCAALVEQFSNHPMAKAVVAVARQAKLELENVDDFQEIAGKGVQGVYQGTTIRVGRESWLQELGIDLSALTSQSREEMQVYSTLFVARGDTCIGWVGLEDKTRAEAQQANRELRELGVRQLTMLTGDRWAVARKVAAELGCTDVQAECLPKDKLELVENMKKKGYRVAVVGDGVNDAPALASGDLGVAMGAAGNDIAINSADIALLNNNLARLPFLIRLSRKCRWVVNENLVLGLIFITGGLTLSGFGLLTPVIAAVINNVGAFVIIFNSARLVRFGEELSPHQA